MSDPTRRTFLASLAGASGASVPAWLAGYRRLSAANHGKVRVTDIKTMVLQGPRTYTLVRVDTDAGIHGFAEAYGSPGLGIKQEIHGLRDLFVGKDPLQIDRLYTGYRYTDGSGNLIC